MADQPLTEEEAKESIIKVTRAYLETYHTNELGLFLPMLEPYLDIPLEDFDNPDKKPQTDFMLTELSVNVVDVASQVLGSVWMQLLQGTLTFAGKKIYDVVRQRVMTMTNDASLAEQMATFFAEKFNNKEL